MQLNIKRAVVELADGTEYEYLDIHPGELGHMLIKMVVTGPEIKITPERREQFRREAERSYIKANGVWNDRDNYINLFIEKESEKFFAIERANAAYNEMLIELSKKPQNLFEIISPADNYAYTNICIGNFTEVVSQKNIGGSSEESWIIIDSGIMTVMTPAYETNPSKIIIELR